jgi:hypothetical protein
MFLCSLHGTSHYDIKPIREKWAENKTKGGKHSEYNIPNYVQHGLLLGLMTHDTESLNEFVLLIYIHTYTYTYHGSNINPMTVEYTNNSS